MKHRDFPFIRLAPWEHLPGATPSQIEARAQSVVPFEWHGEKLQVAARYANCNERVRYIFVQFLGEEDDGNWVMSHTNVPHYPVGFIRVPRLRLAKRLARNFSPRYSGPDRQFPFARWFYVEHTMLGSTQHLGICVDIHGYGVCLSPMGHSPGEVFRVPLQGQSLRRVRASDVLALLREELGREDSDICFMLQWSEKTDAEREQMVTQTRQGTLAEMRRLLACVLRLEPSLHNEYEKASWFAKEQSSYLHLDPPSRCIEAPLRMRMWRRIIRQHFSPTIDEALRQRHTCVRNWADLRNDSVDVEIERPTQHERLEAALFLRDWARDRMSPRKLELLLSGV